MTAAVAVAFWRRHIGLPQFPGEEFFLGLVDTYLDRVDVVDQPSFAAIAGRPTLFLANHQVYVEALLFCTAVAPLHGRPIVPLAKSQHRERWIGRFTERVWAHPDLDGTPAIEYVDRERPDIPALVRALERRAAAGASFLIHVEGTRRRSARRGRVQAMQPFWTDLAVANGWAVAPVRFAGGLPVEDLGYKLELPIGHGRQTIRVGAALGPDALAALASEARLVKVRKAINDLGDNRTEEPGAPDPAFAAAVEAWAARTGADLPTTAILLAFLRRARSRTLDLRDPLDAFAFGCLEGAPIELPDSPEARWLAELGRFLVGPRGPEIRLT